MGRASGMAGSALLSSPDLSVGVYTYDVQEGITRGDLRLAAFFGVSPQDCARGVSVETFFAAMHLDDRPRVVRAVQRAIEDGGMFTERYRVVTDGRESAVRAIGFCFHDEEGRPTSFVGTVGAAEEDEAATIVDRTIEHALAAYRLAGQTGRRRAQYLIALALEDMGFQLPKPERITD